MKGARRAGAGLPARGPARLRQPWCVSGNARSTGSSTLYLEAKNLLPASRVASHWKGVGEDWLLLGAVRQRAAWE
jgi:hypothetical protein